MKFSEDIMYGVKEINESVELLKNDSQTVFHILTGMADTFVLVVESISLAKVIDEEKEQLRKQMCKCIAQLADKIEGGGPVSRNHPKVPTRLVRTASSNYRIHSKKVPNQAKERKMFLESATPYKYVHDETKNILNISDQMNSALISSTVLFKGDAFEISSLSSFKNKLVHTLDNTNFPWRDLVKRSIKAIEAFRKKQPKGNNQKGIHITSKQ